MLSGETTLDYTEMLFIGFSFIFAFDFVVLVSSRSESFKLTILSGEGVSKDDVIPSAFLNTLCFLRNTTDSSKGESTRCRSKSIGFRSRRVDGVRR